MDEIKVTVSLSGLRELIASAGECGAYEGQYWIDREGYKGPYGDDQIGSLIETAIEDGVLHLEH